MVAVLRGRVLSHSFAEHAVAKPGAFFPGRTYLLVDNGTYSMASEFAAMFRDYHAGTILGYETGGIPITFGGPYHFMLKNSRIPCNVAWTQILPAKPWPGDSEHGVIPDVPLTAGQLADFQTEQDPVLAFALRYIKTAPAPAAAAQR
jgi:C-terminal processing protease CtpA/Prc